jgi:transposase
VAGASAKFRLAPTSIPPAIVIARDYVKAIVPRSRLVRNLLELLWQEWKMAEQQIGVLSHELERIADADAGCSRIQQIPGIGPIVATAIVAAIGDGAAFRKVREFAAWLGLVPRAILYRRQGPLAGHKQAR